MVEWSSTFDIREQVRLAPYTSWRVGGTARYFFQPDSDVLLAAFLRENTLPILWLGLGSNLLIRDNGFDGVVICTKKLNNVSQSGTVISADAGVPCHRLARLAAAVGHDRFGFWSGIPGSVGGALMMNAGAYGSQTWDSVTTVRCIDTTNGALFIATPSLFAIDYRHVNTPLPLAFVGATFDLRLAPQATTSIEMALSHRRQTQPIGNASCGSVFRNPPDDYAGRLIDAAGLKGLQHGGAQVSTMHGNFIINNGKATAADIESLINEVRARVADRFGITLIPEVHIVGKPAGD